MNCRTFQNKLSTLIFAVFKVKKRNEFILVYPNGESASGLKDFRKFPMKELHLKKQTLWWEPNLTHFLLFLIKVPVSTVAIRFVYGSYYLLHLQSCFFSWTFKCWNFSIWKNDIREIPNFTFFQIYHYFVVNTEKYNLFRKTSFKRLKSFQLFYEGHIKTLELCTTEVFIYVHSKVKPSMKNKCYNVVVKFIRESEDITAAAFTCPAGSTAKCRGKCNHVGAIHFALEDFNRKNFKALVEPLTSLWFFC